MEATEQIRFPVAAWELVQDISPCFNTLLVKMRAVFKLQVRNTFCLIDRKQILVYHY